MVCDVAEIASGVGVVWVRRDGAGVVLSVAAVVLGVAAVLDAVAVAAVLLGVVAAPAVSAGVAVLLLVAVFAAGAFVLVPPSASPVPLVAASGCACRSAVAWG